MMQWEDGFVLLQVPGCTTWHIFRSVCVCVCVRVCVRVRACVGIYDVMHGKMGLLCCRCQSARRGIFSGRCVCVRVRACVGMLRCDAMGRWVCCAAGARVHDVALYLLLLLVYVCACVHACACVCVFAYILMSMKKSTTIQGSCC